MDSEPTLSQRALNRATLSRQLLLEQHRMAPLDAVEHLVGMQAQNPRDPYIGLWSRLVDLDPMVLSAAVADREAVRAQMMRGTIHLVTAGDYLEIGALTMSVLARVFRSTSFAKATSQLDRDDLLELGRSLLDERPRTRAELSTILSERWPKVDGPSMAQAVTYLLPLVQIPPRGLWTETGQAAWATARTWLGGEPTSDRANVDGLILRYLAAFGPATPADARAWSGLKSLGEVFRRLEPELVTFRDQEGRRLFDLPHAPRPDPDTPAPPRFLPEYDNVLLGHADRTRIIDGVTSPGWVGNLLVDGYLAGTWVVVSTPSRAELEVTVLRPQPKNALVAVAEEGERLLRFTDPESSDHDVSVVTN